MSTSKTPGPRELYELKEQAIRYYNDNGVPQKMEEILNSMFYENPDDVYGHMANYFESFSKDPVISKIRGHQVYDSRGQPTLQTDVYCTIKNNEKLIISEVLPTLSVVPDHGSMEDRDLEEESRAADVTAAIDHIIGPITDGLLGFLPSNQSEADDLIYSVLDKMHKETMAATEVPTTEGGGEPSPTPHPESPSSKNKTKSAGKNKGKGTPVVVIPDEPAEKFHPGSSAVSAVSAAFCQAGAITADVCLCKHIAKLHHGEVPSELSVPLPMVTIISGGRTAPGKSNCVKEYMLVPKPGMSVAEAIKHIMNIYNLVYKSTSLKGGAGALGSAKGKKGGTDPAPLKLTSDTGAMMPLLDRPEQGLDLLQDAITQAGLTPGQDFHIALNCAAQEVFDFEKGKYEVIAGVLKEADGMVEFWDDLLNRYPSVIALIDPMRKQDKASWMLLCEKVTQRCLVMGDYVYHRPGLLKNEEILADFRTTGTVLRLQNMTTVSDVMAVTKKMTEADNQVAIGSCIGDSTSHFSVDLAVGVGARFIMTGAPARGERVAKLNRLIQLETLLQEEGCLAVPGPQQFPVIVPPPPPQEEEEGAGGAGGEE